MGVVLVLKRLPWPRVLPALAMSADAEHLFILRMPEVTTTLLCVASTFRLPCLWHEIHCRELGMYVQRAFTVWCFPRLPCQEEAARVKEAIKKDSLGERLQLEFNSERETLAGIK